MKDVMNHAASFLRSYYGLDIAVRNKIDAQCQRSRCPTNL